MSEILAFENPHYVYIIGQIKSGSIGGPVKIGVTSNPDSRLPSIQTGSPTKIGFVCVFAMPSRELALLLEGTFHEVMAPYRLEGEWFNFGPTKAVQAMCSNVRAMLERQLDMTGKDLELGLVVSGVTIAEDKLQRELALREAEAKEMA